MKTGTHIPAYLLCERFGQKGKVIDLYPPDEQGTRMLASTAGLTVVVQRSILDFDQEKPSGFKRMLAKPNSLPLSKGSFDLVLLLNLDETDGEKNLEILIKSARGLINPSGVIAVQIPNKDARGLDPNTKKNYPDFLDFERTLRKHFPHVTLFSKQPLHGGVLAPLGRRPNADGPILDDRFLPPGGEPPSHFLALCATRFQRIDDIIIAQLPFQNLVTQVRSRIEKLEGTVNVVRGENSTLKAELERVEAKISELRISLSKANQELLTRTSMSSDLDKLKETLSAREQRILELETKLEAQQDTLLAQGDQLHVTKRQIRMLEKQTVDLERKAEMNSKERTDAELERQSVVSSFHKAQSDLHSKQREIDNLMERIASFESEVSVLLVEAANQRRALMQASEHNRSQSHTIDDFEQKQMLKEISIKEDFRREIHALEAELKEAKLERESQIVQNKRLIKTDQRSIEKIDNLESEVESLRSQLADSEDKAEELGRAAITTAGDLNRKNHTIETLEVRAREAELRDDLAQQRSRNLETALAEAESKKLELENNSEAIEENYQRELSQMRAALNIARSNASAAQTAKTRAETAEAAAEELKKNYRNLEMALTQNTARTQKLERDLSNAMEALADSEEDTEALVHTAAERIREIKSNIVRLTQENETELLAVREDLESELRYANSQLEARQGEIWELREEIVRLQAQGAAAAAVSEQKGAARSDLQQSLLNQENLIRELTVERDKLREQCEKFTRSIDVRKKNIKLLAVLLRKERGLPQGSPDLVKTRRGIRDIDIRSLIKEAGGDVGDDFDDFDDNSNFTIDHKNLNDEKKTSILKKKLTRKR